MQVPCQLARRGQGWEEPSAGQADTKKRRRRELRHEHDQIGTIPVLKFGFGKKRLPSPIIAVTASCYAMRFPVQLLPSVDASDVDESAASLQEKHFRRGHLGSGVNTILVLHSLDCRDSYLCGCTQLESYFTTARSQATGGVIHRAETSTLAGSMLSIFLSDRASGFEILAMDVVGPTGSRVFADGMIPYYGCPHEKSIIYK